MPGVIKYGIKACEMQDFFNFGDFRGDFMKSLQLVGIIVAALGVVVCFGGRFAVEKIKKCTLDMNAVAKIKILGFIITTIGILTLFLS